MDVDISDVKLVFPTDHEKSLFTTILIVLITVEWLLLADL
jgi:hypothetical protein